MAITYNLEVEEVGVGTTTHTGIVPTAFSLTGLTPDASHRVRVQEYDDAEYTASLWSAWVDFTTAATLTDIVSPIGTLTNGQTVHPITTSVYVPPTIVETWDLELTETGQPTVIITGISASNYALTNLTTGAEHTVRVRNVVDYNGGVYTSLWSNPVVFTAEATASPVVAPIGTLTNGATLHPIATVVDTLDPVVAPIGTLTNGQTVHGVTTDVEQPDAPIVSPIGTLTNGQTVHAITTSLPRTATLGTLTNGQTVHAITTSLSVPQPPAHWVVEVIKLSDMSVVASGVVHTSDFSITGLEAKLIGGNAYRLSVVAISDEGAASEAATLDFSTSLPAGAGSNTVTTSAEAAIDQFYVTASSLYDEFEDFLVVFGGANQAFDTVVGTFDGGPLALNIDGLQFSSNEFETDPSGAVAAPPSYPLDVEVPGTDWTGASTAASTDSVTLTFSDVPTTAFTTNSPGKPSYTHRTGTLATSHTHEWNNGEVFIPDAGKTADIVGAMRCDQDFTLTLVKNGDYGSPVVTATSTTVDDGGNTRYDCAINETGVAVVGGDRFELSVNPVGSGEATIRKDPSLSFFTLTVTEVYV